MSKVVTPRWGWALTGSGHFFNECLELARNWNMSISSSARPRPRCCACTSKNSTCRRPPASLRIPPRARRRSAISIMASIIRSWSGPRPRTAVAKFVYGISDNLASNVFAQAGKCRVPTIVFACDTAPELLTRSPDGMVKVYPRRIDLENVEKLKTFEATQRRRDV